MPIDYASQQKIIDQMASHGIFFPSGEDLQVYQNDGKWHRFKPQDSRFKRGKEGWYRIWEDRLPNGKVYYKGSYGVADEVYKIEQDHKGWTREEWTELQKRREDDQKIIEAAIAEKHQEAAKKADAMWNGAATQHSVEAKHPYVVKKKIRPLGARQLGGSILIPLNQFRDSTIALVGLQSIAEAENDDGTKSISKKFIYGSATKGSWALLNDKPLPSHPEVIFICEGWATGCSIFEALHVPVVVAFSAGNLQPVATAFREKYPDTKICIAADNDAHYAKRLTAEVQKRFGFELRINASRASAQDQCFEGGRLKCYWSKKDGETSVEYYEWLGDSKQASHRTLLNTGVYKAKVAASEVKACVFVPQFADQKSEGTDFNDLATEEGLDIVRKQLDYSAAEPAGRSVRGRSAKNEPGLEDKSIIKMLGERYVAIDNTDTCWDLEYNRIAKISYIRNYFGSKVVNNWLQGIFNNRKIIQPDQLIFEPDPKKVPPGCISTFGSWPLQPSYDTGKCRLLVEHLNKICGEDENIFNWVSSWLAFPLQHPGAKMNSGLMIYGEREGTGKSIFFNVIAKIYGDYGCSVNQTMIQSDFNGWISQKLFMVGEEVVTNQDKRTLKGMLKNLITNPTHTINEKGYPARFEVNKTNIVFLSNEQQPGILDPKDRRYMAIRFEEYSPPEYFKALADEIKHGGAEALYGWLLSLDLGDFDENTRPLETEARAELKKLGSNNSIRFIDEWQSGDSPFPAVPAVAWHLYDAYRMWCTASGERPVNREVFTTYCKHRLEGARMRVNLYQGPPDGALYPNVITQQKQIYWPSAEPSWGIVPKEKFNAGVLQFQRSIYSARQRFKNYEPL